MKQGTALCLTLALCAALFPAASAAGFRDVPQTHWARQEITDMAAKGYLQGSNGKFRPGEFISKQAFLSMVCRASGLDDRNLQSGGSWADPAIAYGQYFGWFQAQDMNARGEPITREFAAQLLVKALFPEEPSDQGAQVNFTDLSQISAARLPYVQSAVRLGLVTGYEDGRFDPQGSLTRAAAAVILSRALKQQSAAAPGASVQVPILMYHDISYLGSGYSKTPEIFKKQLQELKNAGFHAVFFSQVIDYVEKGTPLPSKPIVISIDDGYQSNYTYVLPILRELDMKAEISVIGDAIQWADWGMNWDQVREMAESGLVSFQAHTRSLHGDTSAQGGRLGVLKSPSENWNTYVKILGDDTKAILKQIEAETGVRPQVYTYPRGKWNTMAEAVSARIGFRASLTTKDGVASVRQGEPSSLRLMDRIGMDFRNGSVVSVLGQFGYRG
ncbi:MAG: polysaccharide deacetylase family protein [Oscillibacter sp.]|nr:polysaccharide deacetylase family protein [Oscillibacter sp.]